MKIEVKTENNLANYYMPNMMIFKNIKDRTSFRIMISKTPTFNCQLSTIGNAQLLTRLNLRFKQDRRLLFKNLRDRTSNQFLIDVKQNKVEELISLFSEIAEVVVKTPYISTNRSSMCIIIFKWNRYKY